MTLADDLKTYFNTNWVAGNCTKPTMYIGKLKQPTKDDYVLYFLDAKGEADPKAFNQAKVVTTPFTIEGKAPDGTNGLKLLRESVRLIDAYSQSLSGAWMEVLSGLEDPLEKIEEISITGTKTAWVAASTW